ncbi:S8 family peptidase [Bacillus sp. T3]|uniref:S8 family peptidase n=1 Tax=Bacillus sp. T3 TaxID=467262 RepID=UPI003992A4BB
MRKLLSVLIVFIFLMNYFPANKAQAYRLSHPPLPAESSQTKKIAIVTLGGPHEPKDILAKFPELKLRYVFKYALVGFSVEGPAQSLQALSKHADIINVSLVNSYKVEDVPLHTIQPISPIKEIKINPGEKSDKNDGAGQSGDTNQPNSPEQPSDSDQPSQSNTTQPSASTKESQSSEPPPTDANLEIIGADRARSHFDANNERLTGKGVTVGVIDTGIDYSHPDLKSNFKGGHDFVDSDRDPMETKGTNGLGTIHGTHVAGIIAANGKIKGVAPEAEIIAYRALGPGGSGTTEQVIAAIDQAIKDKVDILNLSLGNSVNGPDLPISLALNKAVEHGITAVTSSGNSGPNRWTVGSPGTAAKAISVGASTPPQQIPYLQINGNETIRMEPMQGSVRWNSAIAEEIIYGGLGQPGTSYRLPILRGKSYF